MAAASKASDLAQFLPGIQIAHELLAFLGIGELTSHHMVVQATTEAFDRFCKQQQQHNNGRQKHEEPLYHRALTRKEWVISRTLVRVSERHKSEERRWANGTGRALTETDCFVRYLIELVLSHYRSHPIHVLGQMGRNGLFLKYRKLAELLMMVDAHAREKGEEALMQETRNANMNVYLPRLKDRFKGRIRTEEVGRKEMRVVSRKASKSDVQIATLLLERVVGSADAVVLDRLGSRSSPYLSLRGEDIMTALLNPGCLNKLLAFKPPETFENSLRVPIFDGVDAGDNGVSYLVRGVPPPMDAKTYLEDIEDEIELRGIDAGSPLCIRVDGLRRVVLDDSTRTATILLESAADHVDIVQSSGQEETVLGTYSLGRTSNSNQSGDRNSSEQSNLTERWLVRLPWSDNVDCSLAHDEDGSIRADFKLVGAALSNDPEDDADVAGKAPFQPNKDVSSGPTAPGMTRRILDKLVQLFNRLVMRSTPEVDAVPACVTSLEASKKQGNVSDWRDVVPVARGLLMLLRTSRIDARFLASQDNILDHGTVDEVAGELSSFGCGKYSREIACAIVEARPIRGAEHLASVVEKILPQTDERPSIRAVLLTLMGEDI